MLRQNTAISLREKCPYSEFFWSAFSRFQSKCGKIRPEKLWIRTLFMHCLLIKAATNQERSRESEFLSFISSFQLYYLYSCIQFSYITSYSNEQHVIWRIFYILLEPNILPPHRFHKISPSNSISVICGLA